MPAVTCFCPVGHCLFETAVSGFQIHVGFVMLQACFFNFVQALKDQNDSFSTCLQLAFFTFSML